MAGEEILVFAHAPRKKEAKGGAEHRMTFAIVRPCLGIRKMQITIGQIRDAFGKSGYCSNDDIDYATWIACLTERPLLIEGNPGVGKTAIAKALSQGLGLPLIRMQMYDGLTDDQVLYDYDYQRQLLTLEAVKPKIEESYAGMSVQEAIDATAASVDFYGESFLIDRPILRAIRSTERCVLLIDEMDKAPEEIEYMLYEFLEDYSITIPQLGEVRCPEDTRPIVIITSNGYRELSGALRRRCNYLYIEDKTYDELIEILMAQAQASEDIAKGVATCLVSLRETGLRRPPSVSEAIDLARFLNDNVPLTKEKVMGALGIISKSHKDKRAVMRVVSERGEVLWQA